MTKLKCIKTIIILGMPRSFTSMTAGAFSAIGVEMGKHLIGADWSNPKGHFEDNRLVRLNEEILAFAGGSWDNLPPREKILEYPDKDKIERFVRESESEFWGWKDPRTSATIELFLPYLTDPIFVVCYRDLREIARSLSVRDNISMERGYRIAKDYWERINEFLNKYYASQSL